jgi:hypothetical protein
MWHTTATIDAHDVQIYCTLWIHSCGTRKKDKKTYHMDTILPIGISLVMFTSGFPIFFRGVHLDLQYMHVF